MSGAAVHLLGRPDRRPALRTRAATRSARRSRGRRGPVTRRRRSCAPRLRLRPGSRSARRARSSATAPARSRRSSRRARRSRRDRLGAGAAARAARRRRSRRRDVARPMCARCSTNTRRASMRARRDLAIGRRTLLLDGRRCASARAPAALRHDARSRLRHRACRRGVPPACRLAAGVDLSPRMIEQARAKGLYDRARPSPTLLAYLRRQDDSGSTISSSRRMCSSTSRISCRRSARSRACWRATACSASRWRRMRGEGVDHGREDALCARRRNTCARHCAQAGLRRPSSSGACSTARARAGDRPVHAACSIACARR